MDAGPAKLLEPYTLAEPLKGSDGLPEAFLTEGCEIRRFRASRLWGLDKACKLSTPQPAEAQAKLGRHNA